jgi:hypothetical protein
MVHPQTGHNSSVIFALLYQFPLLNGNGNYHIYYLIVRIITVVVCDFCINNQLFRPDANLQTVYFLDSP